MSGSVVRLVSSNPSPAPAPAKSAAKPAAVSGSAVCDRYLLNNNQKLVDAMALAECGLGLRGVQILTGYPASFLSTMFNRAGMKAQSGRRKTCLGDLIRNPLYHGSITHFVASLQRLIGRNGNKLDARVFVTALRVHCISTRSGVAEVNPDLLFAAACSVADGTTTMKYCTTCRVDYACITEPSSLVSGKPYGCPTCRELGALAGPGAKNKGKRGAAAPSGVADLNIGKPLVRFPSQGPDKVVVQSTLKALLS